MLSNEDKKQIYTILAESYLDLLSKGEIGKFERKVISKKILDSVEASQTFEDVHKFLNTLVSLYPAFSTALVKIKNEINKVHEGEVLEHLQSFLKSAAK